MDRSVCTCCGSWLGDPLHKVVERQHKEIKMLEAEIKQLKELLSQQPVKPFENQ